MHNILNTVKSFFRLTKLVFCIVLLCTTVLLHTVLAMGWWILIQALYFGSVRSYPSSNFEHKGLLLKMSTKNLTDDGDNVM